MKIKRCINCVRFITCFHEKKNEMLKTNKYIKNPDVMTEIKLCDKYDDGISKS